jgi:hypothetical protein
VSDGFSGFFMTTVDAAGLVLSLFSSPGLWPAPVCQFRASGLAAENRSFWRY